MEQSILKSTKKILGVNPDDESFDLDIITHINSVFSTLRDLGVGPVNGFQIADDSSNWDEFLVNDETLTESKTNLVHPIKSYMYLKVRLIFDPPQTTYLIEAFDKQAKEFEWRISTNREASDWVEPIRPPIGPILQPGGYYE